MIRKILGAAIAATGYGSVDRSPREREYLVKRRGEANARHIADTSERFVRVLEDTKAQFTQRQREVLKLIALGVPTKRIAHRLGISPKTVHAHRAELMTRLDIRDVAGLVRLAVRTGLISPEH